MEVPMASLGEAYPQEQSRCRELLRQYEEIGASGWWGKAVIEEVLSRADKAAIAGDIVMMLSVYQEMKALK